MEMLHIVGPQLKTRKYKAIVAAVVLVLVFTFLFRKAGKVACECQSVEAKEMGSSTKSLRSGKVIGDVIDPFTPSANLKVTYGTKKVKNGAEFTPLETKSAPVVEIKPKSTACKGKYILIMCDPDAPSPTAPSAREYLHWIVTDIPAAHASLHSQGKVLVEYAGPAPPIGIHRYVFVVYQQPVNFKAPPPPSTRQKFNTRRFARTHGLGPPVAAEYFNAQK